MITSLHSKMNTKLQYQLERFMKWEVHVRFLLVCAYINGMNNMEGYLHIKMNTKLQYQFERFMKQEVHVRFPSAMMHPILKIWMILGSISLINKPIKRGYQL